MPVTTSAAAPLWCQATAHQWPATEHIPRSRYRPAMPRQALSRSSLCPSNGSNAPDPTPDCSGPDLFRFGLGLAGQRFSIAKRHPAMLRYFGGAIRRTFALTTVDVGLNAASEWAVCEMLRPQMENGETLPRSGLDGVWHRRPRDRASIRGRRRCASSDKSFPAFVILG